MVPYGSTQTERAAMAQVLGALLAAGGLLIVATLLLPHADDATVVGVVGSALGAIAAAGVLVAAKDRVSVLALQGFLVTGSLLITTATISGGEGSMLYPPLYAFIIGYAYFFLDRLRALVHTALVGGLYAIVLLTTSDAHLEADLWLMVVGTFTIGGLLLERMVAAVRAQAADVAAVSQMAGGADLAAALQAVCVGVRGSVNADVAIVLCPAPDGTGLTVEAMDGSSEAGRVFTGQLPRTALERAYKTARPAVVESDVAPRGPMRLIDGRTLGLAQPVLRDGAAVAVLALAWTAPRRGLPERARSVAQLFAAQASLALERAVQAARDRERQALEINDNIVQGLVIAKYSAQRGNVDAAIEALDDTLVRARRLISDQLSDVVEGRGIQPGDLARAEAAGVALGPPVSSGEPAPQPPPASPR